MAPLASKVVSSTPHPLASMPPCRRSRGSETELITLVLQQFYVSKTLMATVDFVFYIVSERQDRANATIHVDRARGTAKKPWKAGQSEMRAVAATDKRERWIDALAILTAINHP